MQLVEDGRKVYWITPLKRTVLNKSLKANVMGFSSDMISIWWNRTLCLFLVRAMETMRRVGGIYSITCAYDTPKIHVETLSTVHYSPQVNGLVAALVGSFKEVLYMIEKIVNQDILRVRSDEGCGVKMSAYSWLFLRSAHSVPTSVRVLLLHLTALTLELTGRANPHP